MTKSNSDIIASMTPEAREMVINVSHFSEGKRMLLPHTIVKVFKQNGIGHLIDEENCITPGEEFTQLAEMAIMRKDAKRRREVDAYMATVTETLTHNHGTKMGSRVLEILRSLYNEDTTPSIHKGSKQEQLALRYYNTQAVPRNKISFSHKIKIFWLVALLTAAFLDLLVRKYT